MFRARRCLIDRSETYIRIVVTLVSAAEGKPTAVRQEPTYKSCDALPYGCLTLDISALDRGYIDRVSLTITL